MGGGGVTAYRCKIYILLNILGISAKYICFDDTFGYQEITNITLTGVNNKINITIPLGQNGTHTFIHNRTTVYANKTSIYLNITHITLSSFCNNGSGEYILQSEESVFTTCTFVYVYTNCDRSSVQMGLSQSCRLDYVISICLVIITLIEFI
nr:glycoprotein vIgFam12 [Elephant endotheliotropic herpesvirus 1A]